jgi:hypothetical protein
MSRKPRGTGYCTACGRRHLLATNGRIFLHTDKPDEPDHTKRTRCPGSMTYHYTAGPDETYKEPTP